MNQVIPIGRSEPNEPLANVEAEAALIGAMLVQNAIVSTVKERVSGGDFFEPVHSRIFHAITARHDAGRTSTPVLIWPDCSADQGLAELGGKGYLARLTADAQALLSPLDFADQIHELACRRRSRDRHLAAASDFADVSCPLSEISIVETEHSASGKLLPFEWAGDVEPALDGFWLIDDFLPKSGPAALYGHPGSGKTFLALSIAAHVAEGREWAGRHVEGGPVIYLVAEGLSGFRNRLTALFDAGVMSRSAPFAYIPVAIDLQKPGGDVESLVATVQEIASKLGTPPALIVIDTLSKTFGSGKENTDDMATYVANCERVAAAFDCLTLIVHHRPKDIESRELRGHSSLRGGVVAAILVEGDEVKVATTVKQKDGPEGEHIAFELERVPLGKNSRGKEVTTCLVRMVDPDATAVVSHRAARSLTGHALTALQVLTTELERYGEAPPASIPADAIDRSVVARVARLGQVRTALTSTLAEQSPGKNPDTFRKATTRALETLQAKEIAGAWGKWAWLR